MLKSLLIQVLISLIIIMGSHYLYTYFKFNLTTPKIRDLVTKPNEEYKKIYSTIQSKIMPQSDNDKEKAKDKLKKYMKSLSRNTQDTVKLKSNTQDQAPSSIESYNINSSSNFSAF